MTPQETLNNLPIIVIVLVAMRFIALPFGVIVAIVVRRISPAVTPIVMAIFSGYIIGFVVLFVILWQVLGLVWYDAACISLVVTAGIVFYISYVVKRSLYARPALAKEDEVFMVFDEPVKGSHKKNRRKHY